MAIPCGTNAVDLHSSGEINEVLGQDFAGPLSKPPDNAVKEGLVKNGASVADHAAGHAIPYSKDALRPVHLAQVLERGPRRGFGEEPRKDLVAIPDAKERVASNVVECQ